MQHHADAARVRGKFIGMIVNDFLKLSEREIPPRLLFVALGQKIVRRRDIAASLEIWNSCFQLANRCGAEMVVACVGFRYQCGVPAFRP